jgi:hypothetical protein
MTTPPTTTYREKLWPAPWLYIATALVMPASLLVLLPINAFVGVVTAVVLYAGCVLLLVGTSPVVQVTPTHFLAGKARLPLSVVGEVSSFDGDEAKLELGQRLDARAWLLIRGWIAPVVKIEILDEKDPTPYWVVSTRHPKAVIAAIEAAREAATH